MHTHRGKDRDTSAVVGVHVRHIVSIAGRHRDAVLCPTTQTDTQQYAYHVMVAYTARAENIDVMNLLTRPGHTQETRNTHLPHDFQLKTPRVCPIKL